MQRLAGFLATITRYPSTDRMIRSAVHQIAEAVDAEVCAILEDGDLVVGLGFPVDDPPTGDLRLAAVGDLQVVEVVGLGPAHAFGLPVALKAPSDLVVARSGESFHADERHLIRAMSQVLELAVSLRSSADRERDLRVSAQRYAEELGEANERLEEALQVKGDLIAMTSHELRTPLTSMLGFSSLLMRSWRRFDDDDRDRYLEILHHHGNRLLRLIDDMLVTAQIDSGHVSVRFRDVALGPVVAEIMDGHVWSDVERGDSSPSPVRVDVDHLEQMVANLVDNARKYGEPPVRVDVRDLGDDVVLVVSDAGDGIDPAFAPRLFERFSQASTGDRRESTGVGLGLSIVSSLAELNAATVGHERRDGRNCFDISFPRIRHS